MAELDKKIQKAQTDLVQAVIEAQERKNTERVDMLITNAIKQLKMSRFKPDQTTFISLTYLAKINPKIFNQSNAIKEVLKSLLRRDNGPTNIKGKNDNILPLLAANILLACCDSSEIRALILAKIEYWLSTNQKVTELIQHLLATLCMKCQGDQQTINSLIDMRHHWLQYLEDQYDVFGCVPSDLSIGIRSLLDNETSCDSSVAYLRFLIKHDTDIVGLSDDVAKFIIERPISLDSMRKDENFGIQLNKLIIKVFIKLIAHLKRAQQHYPNVKATDYVGQIIVKKENEGEIKSEDSKDIKPNIETIGLNQQDYIKVERTNESCHEESKFDKKLYINFPNCGVKTIFSETTIEAILTLLSMVDIHENIKQDFNDLMNNLIVYDKGQKITTIFEDFALSIPYNIPIGLRQKLIHSPIDLLVDFALRDADTNQLINILQQFGTSVPTINKIFKKLESTQDLKVIGTQLNDMEYFNQLIKFYTTIGATGAESFLKRINLSVK